MRTNRRYYSYSALKLFEESPKAFHKKYVLGEESGSGEPARFGKAFMRALETEDFDKVELPQSVIDAIRPKTNFSVEEKITAHYVDKPDALPLLGIVDGIERGEDTLTIYEYKTARNKNDFAKWLEQCRFYELIVWLAGGQVTVKSKIIWLETDTDGESTFFTGEYEIIENEALGYYDQSNLLTRYVKIIKEIEDYVFAEYQIDEPLALTLEDLIKKHKAIGEEINGIKAQIKQGMEEGLCQYASGGNINVTRSIRKKKVWSVGAQQSIDRAKQKLIDTEKEWESLGEFTTEESSYISVRINEN